MKKKANNDLAIKIFLLCKKSQLERAYIILKMYYIELNKIELELKFLLMNKPYKFQKNRMLQYEEKRVKLERKQEKYGLKIDSQYEFIDSLENIEI